MSALTKRNAISICITLIVLLILSTVLYYHLKPRHDAIPVYKQLPDNVFKPYFHAGDIRHFTKGALYCKSLGDIKQYYDHMSARYLPGVIMLIIKEDCNYASEDKVYAELEEVNSMFAKVIPLDKEDAEPHWMPVHELVQE